MIRLRCSWTSDASNSCVAPEQLECTVGINFAQQHSPSKQGSARRQHKCSSAHVCLSIFVCMRNDCAFVQPFIDLVFERTDSFGAYDVHARKTRNYDKKGPHGSFAGHLWSIFRNLWMLTARTQIASSGWCDMGCFMRACLCPFSIGPKRKRDVRFRALHHVQQQVGVRMHLPRKVPCFAHVLQI